MRRLLFVALLAPIVAGAACASFKDKRTPSGEFCSDMQVVPAGQDPDGEYHRLQPISSDPKARTEAERLESLRKAACAVGGDAVIEAVNEEVRAENATYATVSSGTAIIWLRSRGNSGSKPITLPSKHAASAAVEPRRRPSRRPPSRPRRPPRRLRRPRRPRREAACQAAGHADAAEEEVSRDHPRLSRDSGEMNCKGTESAEGE